MGHPQGQYPLVQQLHYFPQHPPALKEELDVLFQPLNPPGHVLVHRAHKSVKALGAVVEIRDGDKQPVRREIRQQALEAAKGVAHLLHLGKVFHHVKGQGVGDIGIGPPDIPLAVLEHHIVVMGADHLQRLAVGIRLVSPDAGPEVVCDGGDVSHHPPGVFEHIGVQLLQRV